MVSPTSAFTDRTFVVAGLIERPLHEPFDRGADAQRVGQRDRRFDRAELVDLRRAGELAERVADEHRARHLVLKHIAARAERSTVTPVRTSSPSIERGVPDAHAGDVGDRVERARREHARREPDIARARPRRVCAANVQRRTRDAASVTRRSRAALTWLSA